MNQKRAKAIRRSVYGDVSIREKREYRYQLAKKS